MNAFNIKNIKLNRERKQKRKNKNLQWIKTIKGDIKGVNSD
jgi:hypothetical protein